MNGDSFAIVRSGILDHTIAGRLGVGELGVYTVVHLQADFSTGVWWGSAPRVLAAAPRGKSLRDIQRHLQTLVEIRFLRPFHAHGARGNFPWLIDKYDVKLGALKGKRLNAWASTSWRNPVYESWAQDDADAVAQAAPFQDPGARSQKGKRSSVSSRKAKTDDRSSPRTLEEMRETARTILLERGLDFDLVTIALLLVDNRRRILGRPPRCKAYFVKCVEECLADRDDLARCNAIVEERRHAGIPMDAPLRPDQWDSASKCGFVFWSVKEAERQGRTAKEIQTEYFAATAAGEECRS